VFLDRDGTINRDHGYVADPAGVELLPGAAEAIGLLNRGGIRVIEITNQSGIGRGLYTLAQFDAVQAEVERQLRAAGAELDAVYWCPHDPERDRCECRKPALGLYVQAAKRFGLDLRGAAFVGDRPSDVLAAGAVGGMSFLVRTGRWRPGETVPHGCRVVADLVAVAAALLGDVGAPRS